MSPDRPIINTYQQCQTAGGERIAIYYRGVYRGRGGHGACFLVGRFKDGVEYKTDPDAHYHHNFMKWFPVHYPVPKSKPMVLAQVIAWVTERYGAREFVRNRMGDYVERDVNERFPLRPRERI